MDTEVMQNETSIKIAVLNDAARSNVANYMATRGIMALDEVTVSEVYASVQQFDSFTESNDPYGERDFGSLSVRGEKVFWKIDYYDKHLSKWCDPLDLDCRRVITIMLAEEY